MDIEKQIAELRGLWSCFWQSRVVLTANSMRIFDHLEKLRTAPEVAKLVRADARAVAILLDACTGLGLLKKRGGKYRNAPIAGKLLVQGMPDYQGDILRHAANLWDNWSDLDEIVRTGRPSRRSFETDAFIRGMHNNAIRKAARVIGTIDLKGVKKALDLGGGPGTYSIEMAKKVESVTLFDLPQTIAIARDIVGKSGRKHISFLKGDFLIDSIGSGYDLIFISQIMHSFAEDKNLGIIRKSFEALNPGGQIVIQEHLLEPDRTRPISGSLFSVNMLVNTSGGRSYSVKEIKQWLTAAGFRKVKSHTAKDTALVLGRKVI
jgi:ubiquinone/menaquinone biosynthesis C-methylase UbiE